MDTKELHKAKRYLSKDPIMKKIIKDQEMLVLPKSLTVFHELVKSIVFQQISYKAADSIFNKFVRLIGQEDYLPEDLLHFEVEELRPAGLSNQKCNYILNTARFFTENQIEEEDWESMENDAIIEKLVQIKGVGEWTVQMILLFQLERMDIFPVKDLGIQIAMKKVYNIDLEKKPLLIEMEKVAEPWAPYRSIASRYLWSWKRAN